MSLLFHLLQHFGYRKMWNDLYNLFDQYHLKNWHDFGWKNATESVRNLEMSFDPLQTKGQNVGTLPIQSKILVYQDTTVIVRNFCEKEKIWIRFPKRHIQNHIHTSERSENCLLKTQDRNCNCYPNSESCWHSWKILCYLLLLWTRFCFSVMFPKLHTKYR